MKYNGLLRIDDRRRDLKCDSLISIRGQRKRAYTPVNGFDVVPFYGDNVRVGSSYRKTGISPLWLCIDLQFCGGVGL